MEAMKPAKHCLVVVVVGNHRDIKKKDSSWHSISFCQQLKTQLPDDPVQVPTRHSSSGRYVRSLPSLTQSRFIVRDHHGLPPLARGLHPPSSLAVFHRLTSASRFAYTSFVFAKHLPAVDEIVSSAVAGSGSSSPSA